MAVKRTFRLRGIRASVGLALGVGTLVLLPGLLAGGRVEAGWFIPAFDAGASTLLLVAAALGSLDAVLRRDSRSLPVVLLAGFGFALWAAHLSSFAGIVHGVNETATGSPARWIFPFITITTPALLAGALLHWARPLEAPFPASVRSLLAGLGLGLSGLLLLLLLNELAPGSSALEAQVRRIFGVLGLTISVSGLALLVGGHRGDERIVSGVAAGLVLSAFANVALVLDTVRFSPIWYADHILTGLPFAALTLGQFSIYERSVRAERESDARLRAIFEGSAMGICLVDARGRMLEVNARTEEITGRSRAELRGMTWADLIHPDHRELELGDLAALRLGQRPDLRADLCLRYGSGGERWVRVMVSRFPTPSPGGPYFVAMGHDITEERLYQTALAEASERLATAERLRGGVDLSSELVSSLDPAEIANSFVRRVVATVNTDRCTLFRVEPEGLVIEASHDRTGTGGWLGTRYAIEHMLTQPELRQALEGREAVLGGPLSLDQVSGDHGALVEDVQHTATLPLVVGEKVDGLLVLSRAGGPAFTADDLEMLRLIGHVAALALRNARLFAGAQEASQAKSLFLNMAAHELRTPLTVILGYVSLLLEGSLGPPSESWRPALELLEGKTRELAALVDGILIAARLEEGPIGLPSERLDLRDVLARAVVRLQPRARLTQADVVAEVPPAELLVEAHLESLDQILDNLLNNAIAYSASRPSVRLRAGSDNGQAVVAVDDLGVGIAPDMHERIFERLVRIDQPELGFPPGTGLGLYISRALAERMSGSLVLARSEPGRGSTFELRLPLAGRSRKARPRGRRRALAGG